MRQQALYPARQPVEAQDRRVGGLIMGRVRDLDATTGLATVEMVDGAVVFKATVMAHHANGSSGLLWLPQVEDLVVLAFLQGHKALPVILGSVYPTKETIPTPDPDVLEVKHQSGTVVRVEQNGDVTITHVAGPVLRIENDTISLEAEGATAAIEATGDIQLTHPNGSNVRLDEDAVTINSDEGTKIEVEAGSGFVRIQHSEGNRILVQDLQVVIQDGTGDNVIQLNTSAGKLVVSVLGTIELGGTTKVVLDGDSTGPQIGSGPSHTHQVIASAVTLKGG
jgi:phage baseplate assembly protein gpV